MSVKTGVSDHGEGFLFRGDTKNYARPYDSDRGHGPSRRWGASERGPDGVFPPAVGNVAELCADTELAASSGTCFTDVSAVAYLVLTLWTDTW